MRLAHVLYQGRIACAIEYNTWAEKCVNHQKITYKYIYHAVEATSALCAAAITADARTAHQISVIVIIAFTAKLLMATFRRRSMSVRLRMAYGADAKQFSSPVSRESNVGTVEKKHTESDRWADSIITPGFVYLSHPVSPQ